MTYANTLRPAWTPLTIALMVLGFVVFWPLGLAMLAFILWGDRFEAMFRDARDQFGDHGYGHRTCRRTDAADMTSGNMAFDAYRAREIERLEEERRQLDGMRAEFDDFLRKLRHAKDHKEFDRFMADNGRRNRPAKD